MRLTLVTNIISPHQLPLARQIVAHLGANAFRYVATEPVQAERAQLGWVEGAPLPWVLEPWRGGEAARAADIWLHEADVVLFCRNPAFLACDVGEGSGNLRIATSLRLRRAPLPLGRSVLRF